MIMIDHTPIKLNLQQFLIEYPEIVEFSWLTQCYMYDGFLNVDLCKILSFEYNSGLEPYRAENFCWELIDLIQANTKIPDKVMSIKYTVHKYGITIEEDWSTNVSLS